MKSHMRKCERCRPNDMYSFPDSAWLLNSGNPQSCIVTDVFIDELVPQDPLFKRASPFYMAGIRSGDLTTFSFLVNMIIQFNDFDPFEIGMAIGCPSHIKERGLHGVIGRDILKNIPHNYVGGKSLTLFNFSANATRNFLVLSNFGGSSSKEYYRPTNDPRKMVDIHGLLTKHIKEVARTVFEVDETFWNLKGDITKLRNSPKLGAILVVKLGKRVTWYKPGIFKLGKKADVIEIIDALGVAVGTYTRPSIISPDDWKNDILQLGDDGVQDTNTEEEENELLQLLTYDYYEILESNVPPLSDEEKQTILYHQLNETDDGSDLL